MKEKKSLKKLSLNKIKISNLEAKGIKGGWITATNDPYHAPCDTMEYESCGGGCIALSGFDDTTDPNHICVSGYACA